MRRSSPAAFRASVVGGRSAISAPPASAVNAASADAQARIDRAGALYAAGLDAPGIAREVGLAEGYVSILLTRLARDGRIRLRHVPRDRASTREREREIVSLRSNGLTRREIARRVGLTPGALGVVLARMQARGVLTTA